VRPVPPKRLTPTDPTTGPGVSREHWPSRRSQITTRMRGIRSVMVTGGIVAIVSGLILVVGCRLLRNSDAYLLQTARALLKRKRHTEHDRERGTRILRGMLLYGMFFGSAVLALGVASVIVATSR
jgi:hypothetical protein